MKYAVLLAALLLSGCYHPAQDVTPLPPDAQSVADASEQSIRLLAEELAKVAREVADKADEFKEHGEVFEFQVPRNKIALKSTISKATEALDAQLAKDEQGDLIYDAAKVRKAFTERAEGFERVAKGKK